MRGITTLRVTSITRRTTLLSSVDPGHTPYQSLCMLSRYALLVSPL